MGRNAKACAECAQKCQLIHGNKISSSPPVPSFFKVMIGDRYSEVLFLPPEFGPKVSRLIGQNVLLEDSSGQRWEVTVSNLSGSFAFQQGWNEFSLHHGLDFGDFVVFHYIIGSHFVVEIYTKTGCEKLDFPDRNQRKRSRTSRNYAFRDGHCYPTDKGSMNKQSSSSSVIFVSDEHISQSQREENDLEKAITKFISDGDNRKERPQLQLKTEYLEEPYYLINRDLRDIQGEDRCPIFDLSCFEMLGNNCGADQGSKIPNGDEKHPSCSDVSFKSKIEDVFVQNDVVDKIVVDRVVASEATDFDTMEKNNDFQKMDKKETVCENFSCNSKISEHLVSTIFVEPKKNAGNSSHRSKRLFKRCRIAEEGSKAQSKSQSEIGQIIVSQKDHTPLGNSNQSGKLNFAGNFKESNIPYSTRSQNWQSGVANMLANTFNVKN
ncbi:uncharacterized protein LOC123210528 isoform X3 [Mangifera indica]|uniref:uncharacterized protein LOC123210528 isoform X3 n=1 Tax=Mangifera indica TaxID=29780 RepID=UPI001CFB8B59|nr:uncharacterized protein LOC123210528 isoform X3 [Mangifera indica]